MRHLLKNFLNWLARRYIRKYRPRIIAVTGNVGKTSTKEAIGAVLKHHQKIRVSPGNLNNEFGVPLVILGDWAGRYYNEGSSFGFWFAVIWQGLKGIFFNLSYPEILILEFGADKPGDIQKLAKMYRPHVAVVTEIGRIPVHIEYFGSAEAVAKEKSRLVEALSIGSSAVLNCDDDLVWLMKDRTQADVVTYGFGDKSDIRISDFEFVTRDNAPYGVSFVLNQGGNSSLINIRGSLGKSQALSCAAAVAVGLTFGMSLNDAAGALVEYRSPKGRLRILAGIKNSWLIDDTYNAAPASAKLALETLRDLLQPHASGRKIAVLGDMLELGEFTERAHKEIGALAGEVTDILVCVGARAKFIAEAALVKIPASNIFTFDEAGNAMGKVQELIQENDLVLVKGSQGMRLEKIVEEIMAEPEKKRDLLVRQSEKWLNS